MKIVITYQDLVNEQKKTLDRLHNLFDVNGTIDNDFLNDIEDIIVTIETINEV